MQRPDSHRFASLLIRCSLAAAALCLCGRPAPAQAPAPSTAVPTGPGSISGIWFGSKFSPTRAGPPADLPRERPTADGQPPPLQPWAKVEVAKRIQAYADGHPFAKLSSMCIPDGVPSMMFPPPELPIEILETPDQAQITVLFESMNTFRIIHMNASHPKDPDPTFMGHSVGHWEGDTLVVDTIGLTDKTSIDTLIPHSEDMHLVERFHRTGKDTMEIRTTIEDPKTLTRPYTIVFPFKRVPGQMIEEFVCENNRNAPDANGNTGIELKSAPP